MSYTSPLEIKCILLGESGVGKTSIISRYVKDQFDSEIPISTSCCYIDKIIQKNNIKIKLNIWDTIGQERFRSISKMFLKDTKIVILVYSIISKESFQSLDYWLNLYKDHLEEGTILGVAANKIDLFLNQEIPDEKGKEYAEKNGAIFGLISAKINKSSIDKFINNLVEEYLKKYNINYNSISDTKTIRIRRKTINNKNKNINEGGCCSSKNNNDNNERRRKCSIIIKEKNGCINSVFLGDKSVGKTSIIKRINGQKVDENEEHTEKISKTSVNYKVDNTTKLKIHIYDVDNDKMKTREFIEAIKNSYICFLVYDVNNKESLENLEYWIEVIKRCKEDVKEKYLLYILGNKIDNIKNGNIIGNETDDLIKEGKELSKNNNGIFRTVSAMKNTDIDNILGEGVEKYLNMK